MYTFVKFYCITQKAFMPWMLKCTSPTELIEHEEKYFHTQIEQTVKDLFYKDTQDNKLAQFAQFNANHNGTRPLIECASLENKIFASKLKNLYKFGTLYLRENGSYTIDTGYSLVDSREMKEMIYPEYTPADIIISQWPNGRHWYAKIGKLTVEDEEGNVKWNLKSLAIKAANRFFRSL